MVIRREEEKKRIILVTVLNKAISGSGTTVGMIKLLLEKGANPNLGSIYGGGKTNFLWVVSIANDKPNEIYGAAIMKLLIRAGVDIHTLDSKGNNAIHYVCFSENPNVNLLKFLIAGKININHQDTKGETPMMKLIIIPPDYTIHRTIDYNNPTRVEAGRVLYNSGANLKLKDNQNRTALQLALKYNDHMMIKFLSRF